MIILTVYKPVIHHLSQAVGQNLLRNTIEIPLQLIKSPWAFLQIAKNQQLPLAADQRNSSCNRADGQFVFRLHKITSMRIITHSELHVQLQKSAYLY